MKKLTSILLLALVLCMAFCSCELGAPAEKTFTKDKLTIKLTDAFTETAQEGFTVLYTSDDVVVTVLKEDFVAGVFDDSKTVSDYAKLVINANQLTDISPKVEAGVTCFEFEKNVDGVDYSYLATLHKGSDAFWLIQFGCVKTEYQTLRADMMTYAKSIIVG